MAQASHSVQIPVSQDKVWAFVSKIEKWAVLVPTQKSIKNWMPKHHIGHSKETLKV